MDNQALFDEGIGSHLQFGFHGGQPSYGYGDADSAAFGETFSSSETINRQNKSSDFDNARKIPKNEILTGRPRGMSQPQDRMSLVAGPASLSTSTHPAAQMSPGVSWQPSNPSPHSEDHFGFVPSPPSAQAAITNQRDRASQRFGQITPPDEILKLSIGAPPKSTKSSSEEADAQRQRQERARNAAHTRHARNSSNRKPRKDSHEDDNAGEEEQDEGPVDGKREKYREKNRLAAAKCRSKKKASVSDLEDRHRIMAAENNFRRREERELRDQLTTLRTMALEHGPDRCRCVDLHHYNQAKAAEMAFGHRFNGTQNQKMDSPSQESANFSPSSEFEPTFDDHHASMHDGMDLGTVDQSMEPQSSATKPSTRARLDDTMTTDRTDEDPMLSSNHGHEYFPMFANFLQSSPGSEERSAFA